MKPRYFLSGAHNFWHKNIINLDYGNRPYRDSTGKPDVLAMNEAMIQAWQNVVTEHDVVCYMGNLSFGGYDKTTELLQRLPGKLFYVRGNHDNKAVLRALENSGKLMAPVTYVKELNLEQQHIILSHHPFESWFGSDYGSWNLFASSYSMGSEKGKKMDVGVDAIAQRGLGYTPVPLEYVRGILDSRRQN